MKIAIGLNRIDFGGLTIANLLINNQLLERGHAVTLVTTSANRGNGEFLLKEGNVSAIHPCAGIKAFRKRCTVLVDELKRYDVIIFSESNEIQCIAPALPARIILIKAIHNTTTCFVRRLLWNETAINAVVCVSPLIREMLILRKIKRPVHIIPNCTDFNSTICPTKQENPPIVAYVGRFHDFHKGNLILAQVAAILKERGVHVKWFLAGDGPPHEKEPLLSSFKASGVDYEVGLLSQREVQLLLEKSSIMVVPSNFEAFGLILIEGMATGCIPVCSNAPVFSWILGNHSEDLQVLNNHSVEYADIIGRVLSDQSESQKLRTDLLKRQKKQFSPEVIGEAYDQLIRYLQASGAEVCRSGKIRIPLGEQCQDFWWGRILHTIYMRFKR
ncbi:glycosyltransferase family 4 protein [Pontiellaceae bacterium B12219]|nr:glycosyltransferase family 4 protein [Pontiellaceae bacterium B12219]